jgi:hypothetical protein
MISAQNAEFAERAAEYDRTIMMIYNEPANSSPDLAELKALVKLGLGQPLDEATFAKLAASQTELRALQEQLANDLAQQKILPEQYLERLNAAMREAMARNRGLLGENKFKRIFGDAGYEPEKLIDRETFLESQSEMRSQSTHPSFREH